jgi:hypothetical protein
MEEGKEEKGLVVKEVVKLFPKFREKHIRYFICRGVISYPIKERDLEVLSAIHRIWGTKEVVRFNLSYFSRKRKIEILREVLSGCETKFEVWLYTRVKERVERGERVYVDEIAKEAVKFWKLRRSKRVLENIKKKVKALKRSLLYYKKKGEAI